MALPQTPIATGFQMALPYKKIFHSTISLPYKKFFFWKFLMTSLHVICGLGPPPPIKNPGYVYAHNGIKDKTFSSMLFKNN